MKFITNSKSLFNSRILWSSSNATLDVPANGNQHNEFSLYNLCLLTIGTWHEFPNNSQYSCIYVSCVIWKFLLILLLWPSVYYNTGIYIPGVLTVGWKFVPSPCALDIGSIRNPASILITPTTHKSIVIHIYVLKCNERNKETKLRPDSNLLPVNINSSWWTPNWKHVTTWLG